MTALTVLALVSVGCGNRVSKDEIRAAAAGTRSESSAAASDAAGSSEAATAFADDSTAAGGVAPEAAARAAGSSPARSTSKSGGGSGNPASAVEGAVAAGAKAPITIGTIGSLSGPVGANLGRIVDGVRVWVRNINAAGGLNGHPVVHITGDDGADPARHRVLAQEFVEQRKVLAFVGNPEALTGQQTVEYLTRVGVPVIGSETAGQWFYESPVYFPQASHGFALIQAAVAGWAIEAVRLGKRKFGSITCVEVQVCRDSNRVGAQVIKRNGGELVYSGQASFSQPDYTAECLSARNAGAQTIGMAMDGNSVTRIASSCARQGYHPIFNYTNAIISPQHAKDANLNGSILIINVAPWMLTNTPALKAFSDAMAQYAPGVDKTASHITGWIAAKLFEAGAKNLPEPPTHAGLLAGLWATSGTDLGGLTGPLKFTPHKPATPTACWFQATIKDGKFLSPNNGKRQCVPFDPSIR